MTQVKRFSLIPAAFAALCLGPLAGAASAQIVELGKTASPIIAPACPKGAGATNCDILLTRTTAIETVSDGDKYPTTVKNNGWIVAFTVGLSNLSSNVKTEKGYLSSLNAHYGGPPELAITVLKPGPKKGPRNTYKVMAQSPTYHVTPFLGQVLQEPLSLPPSFSQFTALPVKAGEVIALTVPTWAPVLTYPLSPTKFAYRQSRTQNCTHPAGSETAQTTLGASQKYGCNYTGTRVEYSVTEVVNVPYPKHYVHGRRH
jgi:hypothetical protein